MVLVLSENANVAPHIEREIAHAFYTRRIIVPLRLTNTLPRRDFLFYLGNVRWFDASSSPAEQHLEELTASINCMVRGRIVAHDAMPPHSATKTTTTLRIFNSWIGGLRASHYRTLEILKRIAIAASLFAVGWLFWFLAPARGTDSGRHRDSGHSSPLDSLLRAPGDASVSKPAYSYTRFGLWLPPNTGPTSSIQEGPQHAPSTTSVRATGKRAGLGAFGR